MTRLILPIASFIVSILVSILLIEIAGQVLNLEPKYNFYWRTNARNEDSQHCKEQFCVTVRTNAQGLREDEIIRDPAPGIFRIVMVGDSYTFGWGVEAHEALPKVVQRKLRENHNLNDIEIINLGVPGTSPLHYMTFVSKYAADLKPDLVISNLLIPNDFYNHFPPVVLTEERAQRDLSEWIVRSEKPDEDLEAHWRESVLWNSFVVRFLFRQWLRLVEDIDPNLHNAYWPGPRSDTMMVFPPIEEPFLDEQQCQEFFKSMIEEFPETEQARRLKYAYLKRTGQIDQACDRKQEVTSYRMHPDHIRRLLTNPAMLLDVHLLRKETEAAILSELEFTWRAVRHLAESAKSFDATFIPIVLTSPFLFGPQNEDSINEQMPSLTEVEDGWKLRRINRVLESFCEADGYDCFDITDPLTEAFNGKQGLMYFEGDHHLTPKGNAIAADIIARWLAPRIINLRGGSS